MLTEEQARAIQLLRLKRAYRADIQQQMSEKWAAKEELKAEGRLLREQIEEQDAVHNANEQLKLQNRKRLMMDARISCENQMEDRRQKTLLMQKAEKEEGAEIREEDARIKRLEEEKRVRTKNAMRQDFQSASLVLQERERQRELEKKQDVKNQLKAIEDMEEEWRLMDGKRAKYFSDLQNKQNLIQGDFAQTTGAALRAKMMEEEAKQERDERQEQERWALLLKKREECRAEQQQDMLQTLHRQVEEEKRRRAQERLFRTTLPIDRQMEIREREEAAQRLEKQQNLKMELLKMIEEKRRRSQRNPSGGGGFRGGHGIFAETEDEFYAHQVGESYEHIRPYEGWELSDNMSSGTPLPASSAVNSKSLFGKKNNDLFVEGLSTRVDASRFLEKPLGRLVQRDLGRTTLTGPLGRPLKPPSSQGSVSMPNLKKGSGS